MLTWVLSPHQLKELGQMLVVGWGPSMLMISLFDEEILMISNF